jgi:hypothetical protein
MPDHLRIRIRPDWDAALTYDSLHEEPENRPVFVGREVLIAPLVAEIIEPNKRGTYLISGYRGTGKTTLLIEALSRAKTHLTARKMKLFPLVLNVSEISASLGNASSSMPIQLQIDAQRLLIALIRTIRDGIYRLPEKDESLRQLAQTVNYAYEKATASKFSQAGTSSQENVRNRSWEWALALDDKNVLKTLTVVTGAAAVGFEAAALTGMGWLHAAALGLAAVFTISLAASIKRSRSEKWTDAKQTALEHDNSLQQIETDLKDILASLKQNKLRTVVVMEELDKIDDPKGQQLASVIRYFKNLFTQAPALFFFVTDKSYFDIVASAIKRARRSRSYAVEHTFFTHRIFVGRPTTEESLKFIAAIALDEKDRQAIEAVGQTLGKPGRIDEVDQLGRFIRVVLFNASNHLFDLKNQLRRYVRTEEQQVNGQTARVSSFLIDEQTLPAEEAALAVFQDLIIEKTRSFEIKGGRTYANETLADSLNAVFNELGSNQPQKIDSFLPSSNSDSNEALLLDEQLDLSEAARVREAVRSLISDLERGLALQGRDRPANTFTWRDDAARAFRYVRRLQKHEESLIAELQRHASLANALIGPEFTHPLAAELEQRVGELRNAPEPLTADAAAAEQRKVLDLYGSALSEWSTARLTELKVYGFIFEPVAQGVAGSLHFVKPNSGDPRLRTSAPRGGVLLAFGEMETLSADVWSFVRPTTPSLSPLNRVALVHVVHVTDNVGAEIENRKQKWNQFLAQQAADLDNFNYAVDVIPLINDKTAPAGALVNLPTEPELDEVQRIAASLAGYGAWVRPDLRAYEWIPSDTQPLGPSLEEWRRMDASVFHISTPFKEPLRGFGERDVLEVDGTVVLTLSPARAVNTSLYAYVASTCMLTGFDQSYGGPDRWEPLGKWLLRQDRVILYIDWDSRRGWEPAELMKASGLGTRMIIVKPGSLPDGLEGITFLTAPTTTAQQKSA